MHQSNPSLNTGVLLGARRHFVNVEELRVSAAVAGTARPGLEFILGGGPIRSTCGEFLLSVVDIDLSSAAAFAARRSVATLPCKLLCSVWKLSATAAAVGYAGHDTEDTAGLHQLPACNGKTHSSRVASRTSVWATA